MMNKTKIAVAAMMTNWQQQRKFRDEDDNDKDVFRNVERGYLREGFLLYGRLG